MTKRDFELIARTILDLGVTPDVRHEIAQEFARMLRVTNAKFNAARFYTACGVKK